MRHTSPQDAPVYLLEDTRDTFRKSFLKWVPFHGYKSHRGHQEKDCSVRGITTGMVWRVKKSTLLFVEVTGTYSGIVNL